MKRFFFPAACLALFTASNTAIAQERSRFANPATTPPPSLSNVDVGRYVAVSYAECLVRYNPPRVLRFLNASTFAEYTDALKRLNINECIDMPESLHVDGGALKASLWTAEYRALFSGKTPYIIERDRLLPEYLHETLNVALLQFARCIVHRDPKNSRALILGPVGSKHEYDAFQSITASFNPCMQQGMEVHFDKSRLFGYIAEALTKLSTYSKEEATLGAN